MRPGSGVVIYAIVAAVLIVSFQAMGSDVIDALRWDREALTKFQWWRLWTGHLVHASWPHVGLNLLGLVLVAWIFPEPLPLRVQFLRFAWLGLVSSVLMYAFVPSLGWYVGMSGVLHGSFVLGLWWLLRQGDRLALLLLLLLVGKLLIEHFHGPITSDEDLVGVPVLTEAHSFGALAAAIWVPVERWLVFSTRNR